MLTREPRASPCVCRRLSRIASLWARAGLNNVVVPRRLNNRQKEHPAAHCYSCCRHSSEDDPRILRHRRYLPTCSDFRKPARPFTALIIAANCAFTLSRSSAVVPVYGAGQVAFRDLTDCPRYSIESRRRVRASHASSSTPVISCQAARSAYPMARSPVDGPTSNSQSVRCSAGL